MPISGSGPIDPAVVAASHRVVEIEPWCERPATLVIPENHPLTHRRRLTLSDIVRDPLILPDAGGSWRHGVDDTLARRGYSIDFKFSWRTTSRWPHSGS